MKLIGSRTSPYVRKVRVVLAEKGLAFDLVEENVWNADTTVPRYNPLGKVPVLLLDQGEALYDSAVICEYLDALAGERLIPASGVDRARVRRAEALGDGLADAGIAIFLERKREPARQEAAWLARQRSKVDAVLTTLATSVGATPAGARLSLGDIACACALFWLEFRLPEIGWRETHAGLKSWAERLESRPSFATTRPPA